MVFFIKPIRLHVAEEKRLEYGNEFSRFKTSFGIVFFFNSRIPPIQGSRAPEVRGLLIK